MNKLDATVAEVLRAFGVTKPSPITCAFTLLALSIIVA